MTQFDKYMLGSQTNRILCVCVCVCACVHACVRACVCVCGCVHMHAYVGHYVHICACMCVHVYIQCVLLLYSKHVNTPVDVTIFVNSVNPALGSLGVVFL